LDAAAYHKIRGGLKNSQLTFERNKKGRVAFVGGSITYGVTNDPDYIKCHKVFKE
jgi:hypothetical protein